MTRMFKKKPVKACLSISGVGFLLSLGTSLIIALEVLQKCKHYSDNILDIATHNITIPQMEAVISYLGYNISLEMDNVNIELPQKWVTLLTEAANEAPLCFWGTLLPAFLLLFATFNVLALCVGFGLHLKEEVQRPNFRNSEFTDPLCESASDLNFKL